VYFDVFSKTTLEIPLTLVSISMNNFFQGVLVPSKRKNKRKAKTSLIRKKQQTHGGLRNLAPLEYHKIKTLLWSYKERSCTYECSNLFQFLL
jgi:hypothetical protein